MDADYPNNGVNFACRSTWHVTDKGQKSFWNKVGAAWAHKDSKGFTLQLEMMPINGRIVLRQPLDEPVEKQDQTEKKGE